MIINFLSILTTLLLIAIASYLGLKVVRKFALQSAQEDHDAIAALDQQDEEQRLKKERDADAAAASAFAKVEQQQVSV